MGESVDSLHIIIDHLLPADFHYFNNDIDSDTLLSRNLLENVIITPSSDADENQNNNLQTFHTVDNHDNNNLIISDNLHHHHINNDHQHVDEVNMDERASLKLHDNNNNNKRNIKNSKSDNITDEEDNKKEMKWWRIKKSNNNNNNAPWSYSNVYIFLVLWNFTMITLYTHSDYLLFIPSSVKIIIGMFHVSAIVLYFYDVISYLFKRKGTNHQIHV